MDFLTFEKEVKEGITTRFGIDENDLGDWDIGREVLMEAFTDGETSKDYVNRLKEKFDWNDLIPDSDSAFSF